MPAFRCPRPLGRFRRRRSTRSGARVSTTCLATRPPPTNIRAEFSILAHDQLAWPNGTTAVSIDGGSITVYPNPSGGNQLLDVKLNSDQNVLIDLHDLNGKKINTVFKGKCFKGKSIIKSDIGSLSNGIYYYNILIGDQAQNIKIIKK